MLTCDVLQGAFFLRIDEVIQLVLVEAPPLEPLSADRDRHLPTRLSVLDPAALHKGVLACLNLKGNCVSCCLIFHFTQLIVQLEAVGPPAVPADQRVNAELDQDLVSTACEGLQTGHFVLQLTQSIVIILPFRYRPPRRCNPA